MTCYVMSLLASLNVKEKKAHKKNPTKKQPTKNKTKLCLPEISLGFL